MTKIKGTVEHGLLQMIIHMIWPPLCSFVFLQMIICKEDGSQDDQNQGDGVVENDHPENPPFLCKWSFAKRTVLQMAKIKGMEEHGLLQMTIWMIRPPGLKFAPDLPLIEGILNTKLQLKQTNCSELGQSHQ